MTHRRSRWDDSESKEQVEKDIDEELQGFPVIPNASTTPSPQRRYFRNMTRYDKNALNVPELDPISSETFFNIPNKSYSASRLSINSRDLLNTSVSPTRFNYAPSLNRINYSPSPTRNLIESNPFVDSTDDFYNSNVPKIPPMFESSTELENLNQNPFSAKIHRSSKSNQKQNPFFDSENYENLSESHSNKNKHIDDDIFEGYHYDDDELDENGDHEFTPFPVIADSYYPINIPRDIYDPFEMNKYDDDFDSTISSKSSLASLIVKQDAKGKDAKAVAEAVKYYNPIENQVTQNNEEPVDNLFAKQVRMVNGNLVLDCPVSEILLNKYKIPLTEKDREFLFMRFQACTAQPEDFQLKNFSLRQKFYSQPRETELLIVVTMFNENDVLLARTLKGIFKNIRYLYSLKNSSTWGHDSWQKVVVTIVSDGRKKINPRSKALLAALGVYQEGFAKNKINDDDVISHIYEYTTMVGISKIEKEKVTLTTDNQIPVQLIFCLKEKNQRKINSHKWALKAFAPVLNPNVIILLDVGTQPENKSLYKLWRSFKDPRVAGSCGEIKASLGENWKLLINPLVAAQNFEYKISNILDKPMESVFGFITVLPGAFSAYRYQALLGEPMDKYLKGEDLKKNNDDSIFNANMYLAEDRILCFELIAKLNCEWILKYVSSAGAYTDVPEELDDFISQRRRWLNGSFFAAIYSVYHFYKIWFTSHSIPRKLLLHIEFIYQFLNLLVSWFSLGSYYLVFRILTVYLAEPSANFPPGNILSVLFLWLYLASIVTTFVLSFGNKPKGTKKFYLVIVCFFAILMIYMIFAAVYMSILSIKDIIKEHENNFQFKYIFIETRFRDLIVATLSTYFLYLIGFTLFLQPYHMLTSFVQYLLLSPAYINVLNIYAFCNIHDISWGTKGEDKQNDLGIAKKSKNTDDELEIVIPTTKIQIDDGYRRMMQELTVTKNKSKPAINLEEQDAFYFAFFRSMTVLLWMFSNFIIIMLVTNTGGLSQLMPTDDDDDNNSTNDNDILPQNRTFIFLTIILWLVAFMALFRFIGCCIYLVMKLIDSIRMRTSLKRYRVRENAMSV